VRARPDPGSPVVATGRALSRSRWDVALGTGARAGARGVLRAIAFLLARCLGREWRGVQGAAARLRTAEGLERGDAYTGPAPEPIARGVREHELVGAVVVQRSTDRTRRNAPACRVIGRHERRRGRRRSATAARTRSRFACAARARPRRRRRSRPFRHLASTARSIVALARNAVERLHERARRRAAREVRRFAVAVEIRDAACVDCGAVPKRCSAEQQTRDD
jgi:hypothetical protein